MIFRLAILAISILLSQSAMAKHPSSFGQAKSLAKKVYAQHLTSFYCGCDYLRRGKKLIPLAPSCGYTPRIAVTRKGNSNERAKRIEWEHIMPAWDFGHQRQCWQKGGRKSCTKKDIVFKRMESDLHNLVPAVGELNGDRSNFRFAMIPGEVRKYGQCDFEVDFKGRKTEPPSNVQGDIARVYFYMRDQYRLKLSKSQTQLFTAWSKTDPVDMWECRRDGLITGMQGNSNLYVSNECNN
jgi:deoxyribonuclease I